MTRPISVLLSLAVVAICFSTSCGQTLQPNKLIDEINEAKGKAFDLLDEAERKRAKAKEKGASGDKEDQIRLIEEAAKLYGQAADSLNKAVKNANELAKLKTPEWYEEYFSLQSKLLGNFAQMGAHAQEELLARTSGTMTDAQLQSWKEDIDRINKENEDFRRQIAAIESQQGIVLIKE